MSLLITNARQVDRTERINVFLDHEKISILKPTDTMTADETIDATELLLLPGLIDCHVHFREPGYEHKSTMQTEALAAFHGGVTTVCEMPNTSPPTVSIDALKDKIARGKNLPIDIRFFFGITEQAHLDALVELFTNEKHREIRSRCSGVKIYFEHSTGNQKIESSLIESVFKACAEHDITLVGHCESSTIIAKSGERVVGSDIAVHSEMRPPEAEAEAIRYAITLTQKYGTRFHVAHLSTKQGADLIRQAKADHVFVTCEVAPHHLFLSTDDYKTLGAFGKMNPPLRSMEHVTALWEAIADGTVDCIATDHAPHTIEEKKNPDPLKAPSGVPGVETMLPLLLSVALGHWPHPVSQNPGAMLTIADILRLTYTRPNQIFKLRKKPLVSADIVLIDPKAKHTIHAAELHSKCGWTPFEGWNVRGKIVTTIRGSTRSQ